MLSLETLEQVNALGDLGAAGDRHSGVIHKYLPSHCCSVGSIYQPKYGCWPTCCSKYCTNTEYSPRCVAWGHTKIRYSLLYALKKSLLNRDTPSPKRNIPSCSRGQWQKSTLLIAGFIFGMRVSTISHGEFSNLCYSCHELFHHIAGKRLAALMREKYCQVYCATVENTKGLNLPA